jgi:hypothetical protein
VQTQVSQIQRELEAPLLIAGALVRVNTLTWHARRQWPTRPEPEP